MYLYSQNRQFMIQHASKEIIVQIKYDPASKVNAQKN